MVRAGAIIVLVAALAIAAVGIWLVRSVAPLPSQARPPTTSVTRAADARAHEAAQPAPATTNGATADASSGSAAATPAMQTQPISAPAGDSAASASPPMPSGGLASSREHAVTEANGEPASQGETADAAPAGDADASTADDAAVDNGEDASAPADENAAADANAKPDAIDDDHAADLLADWIASQDAASANAGDGSDASAPSPVQQAWKTFDQESADADWSPSTEKQIEDTLDQWLAGLPDAVRDHVDVIHVECRETLCQILAADNDLATQSQRAGDAQEWQQAIATLPQQPWWHELGFVDFMTTVSSSADTGYALYQTYLRREVAEAPGE